LDAVVIVLGDAGEDLPCQEAEWTLVAEKADHPCGSQKAGDVAVEDETVETGVAEANGVAMMGDERVQGGLLRATILGREEASIEHETALGSGRIWGYQGAR